MTHTLDSLAALLAERGVAPVFTGTTVFGGTFYFTCRVQAIRAAMALRIHAPGVTATKREAPSFGPRAWAVEVR